MACNNDGGDRRVADKCDKRGRESSNYSMQDFFIPSDESGVLEIESSGYVLDLYGNTSIEF